MKKLSLFLFLFLVLGGFAFSLFFLWQHPPGPIQLTVRPSPVSSPVATISPSSPSAVLGAHTKSGGCVVRGPLPDPGCTPGAIFTDATVDQICTPGYSKTVRNVPSDLKDQVYAEYGITEHHKGEYEVDHLISLELGGSNDEANLWPEAADPKPGFHEKDYVENYLHDQVCLGKMQLHTAQEIISKDWLPTYKSVSE